MTTSRPAVRDLEPGDRPRWAELWDAYLTFYGQRLSPEATETAWQRLVGRQRGMGGLVAVDAGADGDGTGEVIGFAHHVVHPHTWGPGDVCYLEDLMVDPAHRGAGVGRALVEALARRARAWGCETVYWHTDEGNARARRLYDSLATLTDYRRYDIEL